MIKREKIRPEYAGPFKQSQQSKQPSRYTSKTRTEIVRTSSVSVVSSTTDVVFADWLAGWLVPLVADDEDKKMKNHNQ